MNYTLFDRKTSVENNMSSYPFFIPPGFHLSVIKKKIIEIDEGTYIFKSKKKIDCFKKIMERWTNIYFLGAINNYYMMVIKRIPPVLVGLKIIKRHAEREPILKLKEIHGVPTDLYYGAKLTPRGIDYCKNFYNDNIKKAYGDCPPFKLLSSPSQRCVDTIKYIFQGDVEKNNILLGHFEGWERFNQSDVGKEMVKPYLKEYEKFIADKSLKNKFHAINYLSNLYDTLLHTDKYREIFETAKQFHNEYWYAYFKNIYDDEDWEHYDEWVALRTYLIDTVNKYDYVIIGTHDVVIYPLALYLSGVKLHAPDYGSEIRIEQWNDGTKRVFYDNNYIKLNINNH